MTPAPDRLSVSLRVAVYIFLYVALVFLTARPLIWLGGQFLGLVLSSFLGALAANFFGLRIYERLPLSAAGLWWNRASLQNLALGLGGGIGSAALVLAVPILVHLARMRPDPDARPSMASFVFTSALLLTGSVAEEMLFRGYGFQLLLRAWGPYATIFPVGVVFAALHAGNPNSTYLSLVNTAGFGILFGYAFLRSRDLWLPIGLHFGWNFTLPLFGANVSGFTMRVTGYAMDWNAGALWSGGEYGPEGSLLTSGGLIVLLLFLQMAPIRRQEASCAVGFPSSS